MERRAGGLTGSDLPRSPAWGPPLSPPKRRLASALTAPGLRRMGFTWLLTLSEHAGSVSSTAAGTILPRGFFLTTGLIYILALGLHRLAWRLAIPSALPILALALVVNWLLHGLHVVSHGQVETLHTTSLALLLFYAGLNTDLDRIRGRLSLALTLPTIGILLSGLLLGLLLLFLQEN